MMTTIAWDVDDVLNALMRSWLKHDFPTVSYDALTENPPHGCLGISLDDYRRRLDAFRLGHLADLPPNPVVMRFLQSCGDRFRHVALTAVPRSCAHLSAQWVVRHFGDWIRTFHFIPSPRPECRLPVYDVNKAEVLATWPGKVILIDDSPAQVEAARRAGLEARFMPQPWNHAEVLELPE